MLHPWKLCKIALNPLEVPRPKTKTTWKFHIIFSWSPLEIPHAISLIPLEIPYLTSSIPPLLFFFSGITQCKEGVFFFFSFDLDRYFILSVKNRSGRWGAVANGQNPLKVICYIYTEEYFGWLATKPSVQQLVAS